MFGYRRGGAPLNVLILLSAMSFLLYVNRVNLSTAASSIQAELGMTNTQPGIAFSAFAYSYAVLQIIGGWIADRIGSLGLLPGGAAATFWIKPQVQVAGSAPAVAHLVPAE